MAIEVYCPIPLVCPAMTKGIATSSVRTRAVRLKMNVSNQRKLLKVRHTRIGGELAVVDRGWCFAHVTRCVTDCAILIDQLIDMDSSTRSRCPEIMCFMLLSNFTDAIRLNCMILCFEDRFSGADCRWWLD